MPRLTKGVPQARKEEPVQCINKPAGKGNEQRGDKSLVCSQKTAKDLTVLNDQMMKKQKKVLISAK